MRAVALAVACAAFGGAAAGCAQPGAQVPLVQAKKLDEATSTIATSCGYAQELTAFGGRRPPGLRQLDVAAAQGARKLLAVYANAPEKIYQGETVRAIVSDSILLLGECGLSRAQGVLQHGTGQP